MSRAEQYEELAPEVRARWMKFARPGDDVFPSLLGLLVEDVRVDYCRMRMPFRTDLRQGSGLVHGGALASLLDAVLVPAVGAVLPRKALFSTVDLHVQFLGALQGDDAVAEGWVTKRGRTVTFGESVAMAGSTGKPIARAILTYNIVAGSDAR